MLFDAAATASSLLKGAMPSFGFGIVEESGLAPPLPFTVCPATAPPVELGVVSPALLFSIVPTESQMSYKEGLASQIRTQPPQPSLSDLVISSLWQSFLHLVPFLAILCNSLRTGVNPETAVGKKSIVPVQGLRPLLYSTKTPQ